MTERGLGYRQKAALALLRSHDHPVAFGMVAIHIGTSPKTAHVALTGLEARGLVHKPRRGWWAAA